MENKVLQNLIEIHDAHITNLKVTFTTMYDYRKIAYDQNYSEKERINAFKNFETLKEEVEELKKRITEIEFEIVLEE